MAEVLIHYSLNLKKGDRLIIKAPYMALPLVQECYRVALEAGAHPEVHTLVEGLDELFFKYGSDHQFDALSPRELVVAREYQAYLVIWGDYNTKQLSGVDPQKIRRTRRARAEFERIFDERTLKGELNWCGTQFPTHADAQEASIMPVFWIRLIRWQSGAKLTPPRLRSPSTWTPRSSSAFRLRILI